MLLMIISLVVLATGVVILITINHDYQEGLEILGTVLSVAGGIVFLLCVLGMLIGPFQDRMKIEEFKETQATLLAARSNADISELELAAIQQKVVEMNQWLRSIQYHKRNLFVGSCTAKEVLDLEPIR